MKFSKTWLQKLIKINIDTEKLVEQLTMVGLEVAAVEPVAPKFHGVVVGEVLEVSPHPNADKLTVCTVNAGAPNDKLTIVCGAKNVRSKLKVPVALVGAELPGDFKIKQAKLRGVDSSGMLCAATELGLAESNPGILELPDDAPVGVDIREYLSLNDEIIEIELTSNRGDCLSLLGIAREVAAINRITFSPPEVQEFIVINSTDVFPVVIKEPDACPHYVGRIIRGINNKVSTPAWMLQRLRSMNETPISFVVDVTNYIMYELGQPLHAFDLAKLNNNIEVRYAQPEESIELLDGSKIDLKKKDTLVIADSEKPLALAGVMGGMDSGISLATQDIFLESAFFNPTKVAEQSRSYKIQTDSSYRFERSIDYDLQLYALNRATALILEIAGGVPGAITEVVAKEHLPKSLGITLYRQNIHNILGIAIADEEVVSILSHLGITLKPTAGGWQASVPSYRAFDLKIEEDLVEEIARIYGYHLIPEQKIVAELGVNNVVSNKSELDRLVTLMEDLGYHEAITYSFIDEKAQKLFGGKDEALHLANPISSEQTVMRTTLWPGLVNVVKHNSRRQEHNARLFEVGLRFVPKKDGELEQKPTIAGIIYGDLYPEQWGVQQKRAADFFDLKNDVNTMLKLFARDSDIKYQSCSHGALHPKRSAEIYVSGDHVGFIGEIHPLVQQQADLDKKAYFFEIDLSMLINKLPTVFKEISVFPKIKRDIAIIVSKDISWLQIKEKIVDISGELLHNISLFDVYCNENIGLDKRSMAIRLIFQSVSRTLIDAEVEALMDRIILVLKQTVSASLRG